MAVEIFFGCLTVVVGALLIADSLKYDGKAFGESLLGIGVIIVGIGGIISAFT